MLKIGIAGYGKRMQSLIKLLTEMEDCRVVAVADPQQPEETALQKIQNPQVRWYGELEEMLKKEPYIWGMPEVLMKYRIRKNSISSNKLKVVKYHWILYREIEHLSVARSAFHICYWGIIKILHIK